MRKVAWTTTLTHSMFCVSGLNRVRMLIYHCFVFDLTNYFYLVKVQRRSGSFTYLLIVFDFMV